MPAPTAPHRRRSARPPRPARPWAAAVWAAVWVAAVLALLAGPWAGPAAAQQLRFRHLGVDDGLPSSFVSAVTQDRRGFLWVGTAHGLSRYDGHRFRTYRHDAANPQSVVRGVVLQVYQDRGNAIWAVAEAGVSRYDGARDAFATYPIDALVGARAGSRTGGRGAGPRPMASSLVEDSRGDLWLGTSVGLFRLDPRTGVATPVPLAPPNARTGPGAAQAAVHVKALYRDRRGDVWVGTHSGLCRLGAGGGAPRWYVHDAADSESLPDTTVLTLAEDAAGALWVGTGRGGLARLGAREIAAGTGRFTRFRHDPANPASLARDRVIQIAPDRSGAGVWVGTENGGLDYYDAASGRFVHHRFDPNAPAGIGSNSIWSVFQDAAGAVWVGTFSGGLDVSMPHGAAVRAFRSVPGDTTSLSYNAVPSFGEDRAGGIWVATDGGGVNRLDPATGRFVRYTTRNSSLNNDAVLDVLEDRRGRVWVATFGGGISRLDGSRPGGGGRFTAYTRANSGARDDNVYELTEDRRGHLWAGTYDGVLSEFDPARGRFVRHYRVGPPDAAASSVLAVRELRDGRLAVGLREGGVTVLDPASGAQTHYVADPRRPGGLASNQVRALLEGAPGVLWVGGEDGLDRLELATGRATHWGERDGLPSAYVDGIVPDGQGRLWLSTDYGLARLDPARRTVKTYTRADGLHGNEFTMRSAFRARDGALYFGGPNGFSVVRPELLVENRRVPPVVLTGLQLFNRPVAAGAPGSPLGRPLDETAELTLTHAQNVVAFEFAALDYAAPEKTRYAYRLDGFDAGWQDVGTQHAASYTNVAPGRYTFRVKASNSDGVWNERGASLAVVVTPPVWQTWWARLLAAAAAAAAVRALWRFQQRRRVEVALSREALRDPLTGLANRRLFRDRAAHALARTARAGGGAHAPRVAVLLVDLDGFKAVNDTLGHHAGDRVLQAVAARLLNATRGCDTVARLGGDEFAVLLENAHAGPEAEVVAARITAAVRAPIPVGEPGGDAARDAGVGASVGIAFAEPGMDLDALLRHADAAMYQAKALGKGCHVLFAPAARPGAAERPPRAGAPTGVQGVGAPPRPGGRG